MKMSTEILWHTYWQYVTVLEYWMHIQYNVRTVECLSSNHFTKFARDYLGTLLVWLKSPRWRENYLNTVYLLSKISGINVLKWSYLPWFQHSRYIYPYSWIIRDINYINRNIHTSIRLLSTICLLHIPIALLLHEEIMCFIKVMLYENMISLWRFILKPN